MGQVPDGLEYLIIGGGRVARHLACYFDLLGLPYRTWTRIQSETELADLLGYSTHVLLAISDIAIGPFAEKHAEQLGTKRVVHFSATFWSPSIAGAHPLMTFADDLYDLPTYQGIPFVLDSGVFEELLPGLANPHYRISPEHKSLYHALCVMSGNFTTMLWEHAFQEFSAKFGLRKDVLIPYLHQTALNLIHSSKGESVLTGPLARGDFDTVSKHLDALADDPYRSVYEAFSRVYRS